MLWHTYLRAGSKVIQACIILPAPEQTEPMTCFQSIVLQQRRGEMSLLRLDYFMKEESLLTSVTMAMIKKTNENKSQ